jgi:hypothetical protein
VENERDGSSRSYVRGFQTFELPIALFSPTSRFARYQKTGGFFSRLLGLFNRFFYGGLYIEAQ